MFSTMITVASTMMPKSIAPIDSRFADSPRSTRMTTANSSAKGMVADDDQRAAQVAEEQPLDQEDQHDAHHHVVQHGVGGDVDQGAAVVDPLDAHAGRQHVGAVDLLDLGQHAASGSAGSRRRAASARCPGRCRRRRSGRRCRAAAGCRPSRSATSDTSTGAPSRAVSMVLRMSSIERIWPTERTIADCGPMFTVLAPTLMLALFRPSSTCFRVRP